MPWFKVDDTFPHHAKVMQAGNAAIGLWVRAGAWSMQQLTDGQIPKHVVTTLGTSREAQRLVAVGLWTDEGDHYHFHQWDEGGRQPSRAQVEADRHAARERQRRARESAKSRRESRRDSDRSSGVSHGPPDPTRPVVPNGTTQGARKRATQLPSDWAPNDKHGEIAEREGVGLKHEREQFVDFHTAKGSTFKDWDAAFRTWLRNATKYGSSNVRQLPQAASRPPRDVAEPAPPGLDAEQYAAWYAEQQRSQR